MMAHSQPNVGGIDGGSGRFAAMQTPELRPRTVGEILDASFKLYTGNIRKLLIIAAVVFIPLTVIQLIVTAGMGIDEFQLFDPDFLEDPSGLPDGFGAFLLGTLALSLISMIGSLFVQGASVKLFAGQYEGVDTSWQESLRFGIDKSLLILGAAIVTGILAGLGLIFFILPGVWLWTSWYVTIPTLLVEDVGVFKAMSRSFELVRRHFWPVFGAGVLAWLVSWIITQLIGLVVGIFAFIPAITSSAETGTLDSGLLGVSTVAGAVGSIITVPFLAAVAVSVYFDLRVRFEGLDLEMLGRSSASPDVPQGFEPEPPSDDDPFGLD